LLDKCEWHSLSIIEWVRQFVSLLSSMRNHDGRNERDKTESAKQ
jgi:hypothetical protein